MDSKRAQVLIEQLREEIRRYEKVSRAEGCFLSTGLMALDALLPGGGFPIGRIAELTGARASGKTTIALLAIAQATRAGRLAAFVDPAKEIYPPAVKALGADLSRLLLVRPPKISDSLRVAGLLARSQAFAIVVSDMASNSFARAGLLSRRLLDAAEFGRAVVVVLCDSPSGLDSSIRLSVERGVGEAEVAIRLERSRMGPSGRVAHIQLPSESAASSRLYLFQPKAETLDPNQEIDSANQSPSILQPQETNRGKN